MSNIKFYIASFLFISWPLMLASCVNYSEHDNLRPNEPMQMAQQTPPPPPPDYSARLPQNVKTHEKMVMINPNVHAWGAYDSDGNLIRAGLATAGGDYCPDIGRRCRTGAGTFRVNSLGSAGCKSSIYPLPRGGAPMPYCMFFNRNQAMHGSYAVVEGNVSHGCVRLRVTDAEWLRFNFVNVGTKVVVVPY